MEKTLLLVTTSLVFACALFVFISIAYSPIPSAKVSPILETKIEAMDIPVRQPASSKVLGLALNMRTLDLSCLKENHSLELNSAPKMLQFKGQLCGEGQFSKVEIINRSNGARAIIFELKGNKFLSDYISLSPGLNQLVLQAESSKGKRFVNNFKVLTTSINP